MMHQPPAISTAPSTRRKKRVSFALDTRFTLGRMSLEYQRSSEFFYSPGDHAAPSGEEWDNKSFQNEQHANYMQLKVFSGTSEEVYDLLNTYKAPPRNEGILDLHPRFTEACALLGKPYGDGSGDDSSEDSFGEDLDKADWILLAIDPQSNELLDAVLHQTWDVEDKPDHEAAVKDDDAYYEPHTPLRPLKKEMVAPRRPRADRVREDGGPDGDTIDALAPRPISEGSNNPDIPGPAMLHATSANLNSLAGLPARRGTKRSAQDGEDGEKVKRARASGL